MEYKSVHLLSIHSHLQIDFFHKLPRNNPLEEEVWFVYFTENISESTCFGHNLITQCIVGLNYINFLIQGSILVGAECFHFQHLSGSIPPIVSFLRQSLLHSVSYEAAHTQRVLNK